MLGTYEINKIYNDDCYKAIKNIPDASIDLVYIDPPYQFCQGGKGHGDLADRRDKTNKAIYSLDTDITKRKIAGGYTSGGGCFGTKKRNYHSQVNLTDVNIKNDADENTYFISKGFSNELLDDLCRVMKKINIYIWCNKEQLRQIIDYFDDRNCFIDLFTWHKCLSGTTEIITKNENNIIYKTNLKDFYKNKVYNKSSVFNGYEWVKVYNVEKVLKNKKYVRFNLRNGNEIKCSLDHKFYIKGNEIEAQNLKIGDVLDNKQITINEKDAKLINNDIAWFIGFFIAQGSYSKKEREINKLIQLSTNKNKNHILEKVKIVCDYVNASCNIYDDAEGNSREIHIYSNVLNGILNEYIAGELSYGKHLSKKCWNLNKLFLNNLLLGYLDGDGCYEGNRVRLCFTRKNYNLKNDLITICNILNYDIKIRKSYTKYNNKNVAIFTGQIVFNKTLKTLNNYEIIDYKIIESKNGIDLYDIQLIDDKHQFVLSDGTLTHNCNPIPTCNNTYLPDTEYCIFARESGVRVYGSVETKKKWYISACNKKDKDLYDHPTIKPLDFVKDHIFNSTVEGDIVLDCFMGSGTTAVACKELNRKFIGFEINPEYYQIAVDRINGISQADKRIKQTGQTDIFDFLED